MKGEDLVPWVIGGVIVVGVVVIPLGLGMLPSLLGPDQFADNMPLRSPLRWEVEDHAAVRWDDHDILLVEAYGALHSGDTPETGVYRLWLVDRATGAVLGRHTSFDDLDLVAIQGGRLWVKDYWDHYEALTLPDLEPETTLDDVLDQHAELPPTSVDGVYFPGDTDSVRILAKDGFLWDLHPDLTTLTRLHHDTPVPTTWDQPRLGVYDPGDELTLPSGRVAILGRQSKRPALRIADQRGALESTEVQTPLEGFLDGGFLAVAYDAPIVRPPEDVFIRHHAEDGVTFQLSRVSAHDGLRWTRGEADWAPDAVVPGAQTNLIAVEDRGDTLFLWLETNYDNVYTGNGHTLVGLDPATGDARWVTRF